MVIFSEVKNELLLWERGPEVCPLLGGCPFLRGSFIGGSTVHTYAGLEMRVEIWSDMLSQQSGTCKAVVQSLRIHFIKLVGKCPMTSYSSALMASTFAWLMLQLE